MTNSDFGNNAMTQDYALTLTLKPRVFKHDLKEQITLVVPYVYAILKRNNCKFTMTMEVTKQFNLHMHGIISIPMSKLNNKPPPMFIYDLFRRSEYIGYICVKPCDNYEGWINYISKELNDTRSMINESPIINDDYDEFDEEESSYDIEYEARIVRMTENKKYLKKIQALMDCINHEKLKQEWDSEVVERNHKDICELYDRL